MQQINWSKLLCGMYGQIVCSNIDHLSNIDEINNKHCTMVLRITFVVYFERLERFKNIKNKSLQSCLSIFDFIDGIRAGGTGGSRGAHYPPHPLNLGSYRKEKQKTGIDTAYNYWAAPPNFSDIPTGPLFFRLAILFCWPEARERNYEKCKKLVFSFGKKPKFTCRVSFAIQDLPSTGCWHRQSWFEQVELQSIQDDACWKCHRCVLINKEKYG